MTPMRKALREALVLVLALALVLGALFVYTGTWPPAVIVESSSMMHADNETSYGRLGTIDPGDLVLVKSVDRPQDVQTLVEGGPSRYRKPGDVLVYFPQNDHARTPIIHRAVAYVEVVGSGDAATYRVRWDPKAPCEGGATKDADPTWCDYDAAGVLAPSVPITLPHAPRDPPTPYRPEHSGFLTKGDNPTTNRFIDQVSSISPTVKLDWIEGKGRGEVPWLGLLKLSIAGKPNEKNPPASWTKVGWAYAPADLWVMLGVTLAVVVGGPILFDVVSTTRAGRKPPKTS